MLSIHSAQVLCKSQHVHYTLWPVESYDEMQAICAEEFQDDTVRFTSWLHGRVTVWYRLGTNNSHALCTGDLRL